MFSNNSLHGTRCHRVPLKRRCIFPIAHCSKATSWFNVDCLCSETVCTVTPFKQMDTRIVKFNFLAIVNSLKSVQTTLVHVQNRECSSLVHKSNGYSGTSEELKETMVEGYSIRCAAYRPLGFMTKSLNSLSHQLIFISVSVLLCKLHPTQSCVRNRDSSAV